MNTFTKSIIGAAAATLMMATSASALDVVGSVANVSGDVLIERNGELLRAGTEAGLLAGDRVITTNGSATLAAEGCADSTIETGSVVLVGENLCESATKIAEMNANDAAATAPVSSLNFAASSSALYVLLAFAAVGIIAAVSSDGDNDVISP